MPCRPGRGKQQASAGSAAYKGNMARHVLLLSLLIVFAGCTRAQPHRLEPYTSATHGFTMSRPSGWQQTNTDEGRRLWFLAGPLAPGQTPETAATEFIVVMTQETAGPVPEPEVRRLAMSLLPMHGVSGFQRTPAGTDQTVWYRFELTGSTRGTEWASLGLLITGPARLHYVVCAGPLPTWRDRQKTCDEVLRTFTPGDLTR
jgi:hypothetical protein